MTNTPWKIPLYKITLGLTVTNISNKKHKILIVQKLISMSLSSYAVCITALESAYTATKATISYKLSAKNP